jgi:hypothetical protein
VRIATLLQAHPHPQSENEQVADAAFYPRKEAGKVKAAFACPRRSRALPSPDRILKLLQRGLADRKVFISFIGLVGSYCRHTTSHKRKASSLRSLKTHSQGEEPIWLQVGYPLSTHRQLASAPLVVTERNAKLALRLSNS